MTDLTGDTSEHTKYECECTEDKKFIVSFDGGSTGIYSVDYCQKCYDLDDKQFILLTEVLF